MYSISDSISLLLGVLVFATFLTGLEVIVGQSIDLLCRIIDKLLKTRKDDSE